MSSSGKVTIMENRAHALAAGLFVLALSLAAAAFVWWLGQTKQDVRNYLLVTRGNVTGLNVQAPVRFRGIRAGRVESIDIDTADNRAILVTISLDSRYRLTRGTTAVLNSQGVTGLAYVQLEDDGSKPEPLLAKDGELPRIALSPTLLDTLGAQAGDIVAQANLLAVRLARLLNDKNLNNFALTLDNLASASGGLKDLPPVIAALRQTFSESNVKRFSATLANLDRSVGVAEPLMRDLRLGVQNMASLTGRLDKLAGEASGELTAATLPRINALMLELATNARQLSRLIETLERDPQALVFGRQNPVPGPGEVGFGGGQ
jgi:phospholipid/cholesterol/gamma-HCH transport system substrate-binding protein